MGVSELQWLIDRGGLEGSQYTLSAEDIGNLE